METCLESEFSVICILWVVAHWDETESSGIAASYVPAHNDGQA
jgi:hypothetical protein